MTYVEQLHAVIDRIAEADTRRDAALSDRAAAVDELRDLLDEQPVVRRVSGAGASGEGLEAAAVAPVAAAASPAASRIPCPDCDFTSRTTSGLAVHRRKRHGVVGERTLQGGTEVVDLGDPVPDAGTDPPAGGYPCPEEDCRFIGSKPQSLGAHRRYTHGVRGRSQHEPGTRYPCPKGCGRDFGHRQNADRHGKSCRRARRRGALVPVDGAATHGISPFEPGSVARAASAANERPPEPWIPKPEGTGANGSPVIHGGKERWLCNRCPAFFPTEESRDRHQATHAPVPDAPPLRRSGEGYSAGRGGE